MLKKTQKPISVLLSLLLVLSVFGGMAFSASAAGIKVLIPRMDRGKNPITLTEMTLEFM